MLIVLLVALSGGFQIWAQQAAQPAAPARLDPPRAGADIVSSKADQSAWPVRVKVFDSDGNVVQQRDVLANAADSSVIAGFAKTLEAGQIVQAYFLMGQMEVLPSAPLVVGAQFRAVAKAAPLTRLLPQPVPIRIRGDLSPGQTNVYADGTPTLPGGGYEVRISSCPDGVAAGIRDSGGFKPYAVTDATGRAAITFEQPLAAGQTVSLCQAIVDSANPAAAAAIGAPGSGAIAIANPLDLGRVRYYFTSGVILSNEQGFQLNSPGTEAALFLGLDADRAWLPLDAKGFRRFNIDTFLDARLTSVPTQQTSSGTGITVSSTLQSFTESQKAATFLAGAYLPLITGAPWSTGQGRYSLFAAPLAKAGFTTLAGNDTSATQVTDRFFKSYSFGARLGVFQHFNSDASAPELISYVDFSAGRFGDFEAFRDLAAPPGAHEYVRVRPWRYSLEGLFKVPHSPVVLGFDANIGMGSWSPGKSGAPPFTQPADDLRFLIGAQFDFSRFLKAIPEF